MVGGPCFVVGLAAEAALLSGFPCFIGGGTAQGAVSAAEQAVAAGATALISFGLAGGLDPDLPAGALIIPRFVRVGSDSHEADADLVAWLGGTTQQVLLAGTEIVGSVAAKQALWRKTGASAVDLESGVVAQTAIRHSLPFAVLRAVCDPAGRDLPPAALIPLAQGGGIPIARIVGSVAARPGQIPVLISLGRDAAAARRALAARVRTHLHAPLLQR